jgi:hypothetical protein
VLPSQPSSSCADDARSAATAPRQATASATRSSREASRVREARRHANDAWYAHGQRGSVATHAGGKRGEASCSVMARMHGRPGWQPRQAWVHGRAGTWPRGR